MLPPLRDAPALTRVGDTLLRDWPKLELRLDVPVLTFGALEVLREVLKVVRDVPRVLLLRWPPKPFAVLKRTLPVCLPAVLPVFFSSNVRTEEVVVVPDLPPEMRMPEG